MVCMSAFVESDIRRDTGGRFAGKSHTTAEVTLPSSGSAVSKLVMDALDAADRWRHTQEVLDAATVEYLSARAPRGAAELRFEFSDGGYTTTEYVDSDGTVHALDESGLPQGAPAVLDAEAAGLTRVGVGQYAAAVTASNPEQRASTAATMRRLRQHEQRAWDAREDAAVKALRAVAPVHTHQMHLAEGEDGLKVTALTDVNGEELGADAATWQEMSLLASNLDTVAQYRQGHRAGEGDARAAVEGTGGALRRADDFRADEPRYVL
jgi:hypothetical protein